MASKFGLFDQLALGKPIHDAWTVKDKTGKVLEKGSPERQKFRMDMYKMLNAPKSNRRQIDYDVAKSNVWYDSKENLIKSSPLFSSVNIKSRKDIKPFSRGRLIEKIEIT